MKNLVQVSKNRPINSGGSHTVFSPKIRHLFKNTARVYNVNTVLTDL